MDSDFLTTHELTLRYNLPDSDIENSLYRLLEKWRDKGLLKEGVHWKYGTVVNNTPVRVYSEQRVVMLLLHSEHHLAVRIRLHHAERIRTFLTVQTKPSND
jgi:hypothetical protein